MRNCLSKNGVECGTVIKEWSRVRNCLSKNGVECGTVYQRMEWSGELFIKERSRVRNCLLKRGRDECGN